MPNDTPLGIRNRAIFETAYGSGLRVRELSGLDVDSVDLSLGTIRVLGKGNRERVSPMTRAATESIRHYLAETRPPAMQGRVEHGKLWVTLDKGRPLSAATIGEVLRQAGRKLSIPTSGQYVRRAFATHLLRHGASPIELKMLLGHATFRHLRHYLRGAPEHLREVHRKSRLGR